MTQNHTKPAFFKDVTQGELPEEWAGSAIVSGRRSCQHGRKDPWGEEDQDDDDWDDDDWDDDEDDWDEEDDGEDDDEDEEEDLAGCLLGCLSDH